MAFLVQSEEILPRRSLWRFVRMRCLCACGVFVHWSRPRSCHSRVARALCMCVHVRGAVSCELCVCGVFFFCVRWIDVLWSTRHVRVCGELVVAVSIVRSPLTPRAVPRAATLSGSFPPVRVLRRPGSPATLACPAGPACPACPASGHEG